MAAIERRCTRCARNVGKGRKSCPKCGGTNYSYRVRYHDPDGNERSKSYKRRADAEQFETEVSHQVRAGSYIDPAAGRQTVQAFLEEWLAHQVHYKPNSVTNTRSMFRRMVYPHLGGVTLGRLRPSDIRSWQLKLLQGWDETTGRGKVVRRVYAKSTVAEARDKLAGAFNTAVSDRRIASNPCAGAKAPKAEKKKVVPRTIEQVRAGTAAMPEHLRAAITVVAGSGLRCDELLGLTVDRVNFLRREIKVDRQLIGVRAGGIPVYGSPKSEAGNRDIPVPQFVIDAIAAHLAKYPPGPHGLIFTNRYGNPVTSQQWATAWNSGCRQAMGLQPREGVHHVRHFYASLLIADGRPVTEVQERLGHASAHETLSTYAHLWHGADEGTRGALEKAFEPAVADAEDAR